MAVANDNPRIVRAGRVGFAVLLAVELFVAAVVFAVGQSNPSHAYTTRSVWWLLVVAGWIPVTVVSGLAVRRGYAGHRLVLWSTVVLTASLYVAFPFGFTPADHELRGLGRFAHGHHAIDVVVLLVPSLILLGAEVLRGQEQTDEPTIAALLRRAPRGAVVGIATVLLVLLFLAGAAGTVPVIALGVLLLGGGLIVGLRSHAAMRRVRRDLE